MAILWIPILPITSRSTACERTTCGKDRDRFRVARGIGAACAEALAADGASVVVTDLLEAEATAAQIRNSCGQAFYLSLDVIDAANWSSVVAEATGRLGRVDVLVNNAGIDIAATNEDARIEDFRRIVEINLFGELHGMQAVIPAMKLRGGGSIINVASLAASKSRRQQHSMVRPKPRLRTFPRRCGYRHRQSTPRLGLQPQKNRVPPESCVKAAALPDRKTG